MFIGHHAVAFAAKKTVPAVSLGTLFLAAQFLDQLWPTFVLLGFEHVRVAPGITAFSPLDLYDYPISHSLLTSLGWSVAFAGIYYVIKRSARNAWIVGGCVFSHWVLDFITHRPDMPIAPGIHIYWGLGLWNSVPGTVLVEGSLFLGSFLLYARVTEARDRTGSLAFWSLVVFLGVAYAVSIVSPPPPSETAIALGAQSAWLIVVWAYWIDRHRVVRSETSAASRG
ncbi:MAG: hypothetical protein WBD36_07895 [Bacteroidota bacterium]